MPHLLPGHFRARLAHQRQLHRIMAGSAGKHWSEMSESISGNAQYSPNNEDTKNRMPGVSDCIDEAILRELEADSRLHANAIAGRIGISPGECASRITELERAGHITGYTLKRSYPDPALRPISAVITVVQDRSRTGADLLRSLDFIPEIVTVEMSNKDRSLLLRLQTTKPGRIESIASALRIQSAVESVDVTPTTLVLSHLGL